jgi:IS30 family transposase
VIAGRLGRTPSTVSREVARNGGRAGYRACRADRAAVRNMRRLKVAKLARCRRLRAVVETPSSSCAGRRSRSRVGWSWSSPTTRRCECPTRRSTCRYRSSLRSRALRKELTRYLRLKRSVRRPGGKAPHNGQSHIPAVVNIRERPAEAEDRAVPGHWESQWCCHGHVGRGHDRAAPPLRPSTTHSTTASAARSPRLWGRTSRIVDEDLQVAQEDVLLACSANGEAPRT